MAQSSNDREIVNRLQRRFSLWKRIRYSWNCEYDAEGRLISISFNELGLSDMPSEIGQLSKLQTLYLKGNLLSTFPPEIQHLSNLRALYLEDNHISTLPPEIRHLSNLQTLDLGSNRLSTLPPEIGYLSNLQTLYLEKNLLSALPSEIGYLSNLQAFYLRNNQLSDLPPEIGYLSNLQTLDLENNQLNALPPETGYLSNLQRLYLWGNQLGTPPPEIVEHGLPAILAYLRELQKPWVERYEAKLILVGEARMGKSSLLRALQGLPFDPLLLPTHGIDVAKLQVVHPTIPGEKITLHMWDFGGQQIYQSTHQFFLTRRSVYLLVWNAAANPEASRLSFWLDTITTLAPDARILLVNTYTDQWYPTLSLEAYRQRYPQIIEVCEVSSKDGKGLDELKRRMAVVAANTAFVGMTWPRSWVKVETQLLARSDCYIDVANFLDICRQQKIEADVAHGTLGPYLHDLGKVLYFYDDPFLRRIMMLKPNWIIKVISQVLLDPALKQTEGTLNVRDLPRIWDKDEQDQPYDAGLYPLFLRLMQRFDLCFALETDQPGRSVDQYLFPLLLSDSPPASLTALPEKAQDGQRLMRLYYQLNFVPSGLMSWLLVRTHRYSQHLHWRTGTRLAFQGQQAHIELDENKRVISLIAWGSSPYPLLLILKATLDELLERFQGLQVRQSLLCVCGQHEYFYDDLSRQYTQDITEITCSTSNTQISLAHLLYGIGPISVLSAEKSIHVQSARAAEKTRILFLAANPRNTSALRLGEEIRGIETALRIADYRDNFDIHQHWSVRVADLQDALFRYKPHIVHFSGHGKRSSEIMLEDEVGERQLVSPRALSGLFAMFKDNLRCVVLNACYSGQQGLAIGEQVDCVVGMSQAIGDAAAIYFATAFYGALGYGESVQTAFEAGCVRIDLENLNEQDTPKLIALKSDPTNIRFASKQ